MIKLLIVAEVYDEEYSEIVDGSSFNPKYPEIDKVIEWPVVPRVGEWFYLTRDQGVIGQVLNVFHYRNEDNNPEIRIYSAFSISDYDTLSEAGWQSFWSYWPNTVVKQGAPDQRSLLLYT